MIDQPRIGDDEQRSHWRERDEVDDQIAAYISASALNQKAKVEKDRRAERMLIESTEAAKRERLEREADRLESEAERRNLAAIAATRLARRTRYAAVVAAELEGAIVAGELPAQNVELTAAALVGGCGEALVGPLSPMARARPSDEEVVSALRRFVRRAVGDPAA